MKITQEYGDDMLMIHLSGELGHHEARDVMEGLDTVTALYPVGNVVLELSGMTFMDSSGLAVVLHLQRSLRAAERALAVTGTNQQAMRVFRAAGLPKLIRFEEGK